MTDHYDIIAFNSTHHAIGAEQRLQAAGFHVRIIPVPTQVTAGCGLALRFSEEDFHQISQLMSDIKDIAFYSVSMEGRRKTVIPLENI